MPLTPPVPEDPALVGGGGGCGVHRSKNRVTVRIVRAFLLAGVCVAMRCFSRAQIIRAPINCALRSAASRINQHIIQLVTHTHAESHARNCTHRRRQSQNLFAPQCIARRRRPRPPRKSSKVPSAEGEGGWRSWRTYVRTSARACPCEHTSEPASVTGCSHRRAAR